MKNCNSCGDKIEKKQRRYACGCGVPLCKKCMTCKDCLIIAQDQQLVEEYRKEKYSSQLEQGIVRTW